MSKRLLRESPLFSELNDDQLEEILGVSRQVSFERGHVLFVEGDLLHELYIVDQGRVAIDMGLRLGGESSRRATIETASHGQLVAWAAVSGYPAIWSAHCIDQVTALAIDGRGLRRFLEEQPKAGVTVMMNLLYLVRARLAAVQDTLVHVLSIASHDLKSPINAVQSYLQVILNGYVGELTEQQRSMLSRSTERLSSLVALIDDLLELTRLTPGEMEKELVDPTRVAEASVGNIQPQAEAKGVELLIDVPPDLPMIPAHLLRMQQLITNLVGNAMKFTPAGGKVVLRMRDSGDYLLTEVLDNGPGIPAEELPRIFDDFYRGTGATAEGAGLGLSIVRRIVQAHGGQVWAESPHAESATGTKISFLLPKATAEPEARS